MLPTDWLKTDRPDLLKIRDMVDSRDSEIAHLGATLFFQLNVYERQYLFGHSHKEKQDLLKDGCGSSTCTHPISSWPMMGKTQEFFYRKGKYCLYRAWGSWIYEEIAHANFEIRTHRIHVDLN